MAASVALASSKFDSLHVECSERYLSVLPRGGEEVNMQEYGVPYFGENANEAGNRNFAVTFSCPLPLSVVMRNIPEKGKNDRFNARFVVHGSPPSYCRVFINVNTPRSRRDRGLFQILVGDMVILLVRFGDWFGLRPRLGLG